MRTFTLLLVFLLFSIQVQSQSISRSVISTSGSSIEAPSGTTVSWTLGGVFSQTVENGSYITEGFQQGDLKKTPVLEQRNSAEETQPVLHAPKGHAISVYPTLASSKLYFQIKEIDGAEIEAKLVSQNGQISTLRFYSMNSSEYMVEGIEQLSNGVYFLQVSVNGEWLPSQKFIKV